MNEPEVQPATEIARKDAGGSLATARGSRSGRRPGATLWLAAAAVVALILFVPASLFIKCNDEPLTDRPSIPQALVHNFVPVHPYLYRGGTPSPAGLKVLKDLGVTTVIDLRVSKNLVQPEIIVTKELGLRYINLPCSVSMTPEQYRVFFDTIDAERRDGRRVYVHCAHGTDRTGLAIAAWRVGRDGWSVASAANEMFQRGFVKRHLPFAAAEMHH